MNYKQHFKTNHRSLHISLTYIKKMANVAKDLHRLIRRVGKLTDGQASICDLDWDDLRIDSFKVEIKPNSGYYKGGSFKFKVIYSYIFIRTRSITVLSKR